MTKAVFTASDNTVYDDLKDQWYHFPHTYLGQVQEAVGDRVLFYQPRRNSGPTSADGSQAYVAAARVVGVRKDSHHPGHYFADLAEYVEFDTKVPFKAGGKYFEAALQKPDGSTNRGAFGRSVRLLPDAEFNEILALGLAGAFEELHTATDQRSNLESPAPLIGERPTAASLVERKVRDIAFRRNVLAAYDGTCAVTGLRVVDGLGRFEVQAAHVRAVAKKGSDWVRNGIAMTATVHWLFDRGLISINDDYSVLVSRQAGQASAIIAMRETLLLPPDPSKRPHCDYLNWHRENVYQG
ncbi:HNH endonuclease [Stenotrophomonas sp.]|uniref:HNH endonuclease n=1 Tax=Stenotrophomonas sp. TaxID=69392 RepID=UPI0028A60418|nr:HNH endonuclease [Stenotrophomonas sp.]